MTKKIKVILSGAIAVVVASTAVGYSVISGDKEVVSAVTEKDGKIIEDTINETIKFTKTGEDKEETVYVISDASGNVEKTVVSDWLKNKEGGETIADKTNLSNIENVKSYAGYTEGKNGEIIWNADGEDIYYQGETNEKLPVDVKLTYYLDGKEIMPEELAGESGKVTLRFDYNNNQSKQVKINGKEEKMYVPFTMISGMILDGSKFSNIEINSGKVISDGDRFIVVGVAFPGMKENLNMEELLKDADINIPETVEITADVKDFELSMTLTMGSADLISQISTDNLDTIDELKDTIDKLVSATDELKSGTTKIKGGLGELNTSFGEYKNGVNSLIDGVTKVDEGVAELQEKSAELVNGVEQINNGAARIETNMQNVLAAFKDNEETGGYGLTGGSVAVSQGVDQVVVQISGMITQMQQSIQDNNTKMTQLQTVLQGGISPVTGAALTAEEVEAYKAQLNQLGGANAALAQVLAQMNPEAVNGQLTALQQGASNLSAGVKTLETGLTQLESEGTAPLATGTAQLNSKVPELVGAVAQLKEGTATVNNGGVTLKGATVKISEGIAALYDGTVKLDNGMEQFKSEAIDKIKKVAEGVLEEESERIKEVVKLANDYTIFSDAAEGKSTSVKFIYETSGITK